MPRKPGVRPAPTVTAPSTPPAWSRMAGLIKHATGVAGLELQRHFKIGVALDQAGPTRTELLTPSVGAQLWRLHHDVYAVVWINNTYSGARVVHGEQDATDAYTSQVTALIAGRKG